MKSEKDWQSICRFGFSMIIVGVVIFVFSGANFQWLIDRGYVLNAPVLVLASFVLIGSAFAVGGFKWKSRIERVVG
jgi:hypothetical protein